MPNGDPLRVGVIQPPDNRTTSATLLVHNGSAFGDQRTAFWVQRLGAPVGTAAIRGDNLSTGPTTGGVRQAGVVGVIPGASAGIGVLGAASRTPNIFFGETGVMGVTNSFGVVGQALTGAIVDDSGSFIASTGVVGQCDAGVGVHGIATSGWGIIGQSVERAGVTGRSVTGVGMVGVSRDEVGVQGFTQQGLAGIRGSSHGGYGVIAESTQGIALSAMSPTNAIQGYSTGSGGASIGVAGWSEDGAGVQGDSNTGIGVGGRSPNGWAGYFQGNVIVHGAFYVVGGPKSAIVKHPDGTHRSLFCLESPESYFEDFGEIVLTGPSVRVKLNKDFGALVKRNNYQVFLTSYSPEALYVRRRSPMGFEIARVNRDTGGKPRSVRVGYRIVAHRADLRSVRLPKIKMPQRAAKVTKPDLPTRKAKLMRADALAGLVKLDRLPATPKIPSLDLSAIAEANG